jgi:hypothetical protein
MKSKGFLVALVVVALLSQNASAIPAGGVMEASYTETLSITAGSALVDCEVYSYASGDYEGKYVYTYQISNIDSGIGLSLFSVGILDGAGAESASYDHITGAVDPINWAVVGSPAQSVDALFINTIGNGQSSALLWFASDYASTLGNGALFGTSSGIPYYATGDLLTPVPEPATLTLFGIGALITLTRRRRPA